MVPHLPVNQAQQLGKSRNTLLERLPDNRDVVEETERSEQLSHKHIEYVDHAVEMPEVEDVEERFGRVEVQGGVEREVVGCTL